MDIHPLDKFKLWHQNELKESEDLVSSACCLSTIGLDGYPNARFLSLKEIVEEGMVITGPMDSRKGKEMEKNPKVALSFWWANTNRQVRIQGTAIPLTSVSAKTFFKARDSFSQLVSIHFQQGVPARDYVAILERFEELKTSYQGNALEPPKNWGGWVIKPIRMEFIDFKRNRLHVRELFVRDSLGWMATMLQP